MTPAGQASKLANLTKRIFNHDGTLGDEVELHTKAFLAALRNTRWPIEKEFKAIVELYRSFPNPRQGKPFQYFEGRKSLLRRIVWLWARAVRGVPTNAVMDWLVDEYRKFPGDTGKGVVEYILAQVREQANSAGREKLESALWRMCQAHPDSSIHDLLVVLKRAWVDSLHGGYTPASSPHESFLEVLAASREIEKRLRGTK
jgi:hypothetical protein